MAEEPSSQQAEQAQRAPDAQSAAGAERRSLLAPDVPRWPVDPARPIVSLQGVTRYFDGRKVLDDLSIDVQTGRTTVILGQSGSGKSVLLKHMNGLLRPNRGRVLLFGEDLARLPERRVDALRKRTGMVLQNYALIDSIDVMSNVAFPLRENSRLSRSEIEGRVMELLEMLGIAQAARRLPSELSGGMKKRVSFARAVITEPELVLFDEPTTGLDPVMIEFVDALIIQMRERFQITSVIISHDIGSVFRLADHIAMLKDGRIVAQGSVEEIRESTHPDVQRFVSVGGSGRLSAGLPEEEKGSSVAAGGVQGEPIVSVRGLHKYFGVNHVLRGIDLDLYAKEISVLIGGSGSGKSVLMKHILGLFRPSAGTLRVLGQELTQASERELQQLRTRIGMLFQNAALFDSMTVQSNVAFPLVERGRAPSRREVARRVGEVLERLHLEEIAQAWPSEISAGQRKRVGLARAIVTRPEIMIYDEPTTGQDPIMIKYVDDMIVEAHAAFDLTSLVISHDMQSTFRIADRIAMLYQGEIAAVGTPAQVLASRREEVRRFVFAGSPETAGTEEVASSSVAKRE